jgi:hypothetical protein
MDTVSRRNLLAATSGGSLAAAAVQALPPQGTINAKESMLQ